MNKLRIQRADAFWLAATALVILLQFWWLPGQAKSPDDSYSNSVAGHLGYFRVLDQLYPQVRRETKRVVPEFASVAFVIAPDRLPSRDEESAMYDFVSNGGTLVYAPPWFDENVDLEALKIKMKPIQASFGGDPVDDTSKQDSQNEATQEELGPQFVLKIEAREANSKLTNQSIQFRSSRTLSSRKSDDVLLDDSEGVQISSWELGYGRVIACTSPDLFSNPAMLDEPKAELAVRIAEYCFAASYGLDTNNDEIVFCEFLNASDAYQYTGVLLNPSLRSSTLQLLLVALLVGWFGFHRFGPAEHEDESERRSLVESAQAVGNLVYRTGDGGSIVRSYLHYLQSRLRQMYGGSVRLEDSESLGSRTGIPQGEIEAKIKECKMQAKAAKVAVADAADSVRWLSRLQQSLIKKRTTKKKAG